MLGIAAGLDESVASSRVNRYELGIHSPVYPVALKLAEVLDVPVAYLYCDDDTLAEVILAFHRASSATKRELAVLLQIPKKQKSRSPK